MNYSITSPDAIKQEIWKEDTLYKLTGGFNLDKTNLPSALTELAKGALINIDQTTRVAKVVKTAVLYENALNTDVAYKVKKNHLFKVGDIFAATVGSKAYAITAIDTSNAAYDVITVGTTLGAALTAGAIFFQSSATGASAAAENLTANCMLCFDTNLTGTIALTVTIAALEVKESKLPYGVHAINKTSLTTRFYFV